MKKKTCVKLGLWLGFFGLLASLAALNPARATRIFCRIAVGLELYGTENECRHGCGSRKKPGRPKSPRKQQKNSTGRK